MLGFPQPLLVAETHKRSIKSHIYECAVFVLVLLLTHACAGDFVASKNHALYTFIWYLHLPHPITV